MNDLNFLAKNLSVLYAIPVRTYINNEKILYFSSPLENDPVDLEIDSIKDNKKDCFIYTTSYLWYYGIIRYYDDYLIIGPIGNLELSPYEMNKIYFALTNNKDSYSSFVNAIRHIDNLSVSLFAELICLYYYALTNKKKYYTDLYDSNFSNINEKQITKETKRHSSTAFENQMIEMVKGGDVDKLKHFLLTTNYGNPGKAVNDPLRQAKNYFCSAITLVSREAIKCGIDEETSLDLSDIYIQQAEMSSSVETVYETLFKALTDYTEKIGQFTKEGHHYSLLTSKAIQFMYDNLTSSVSSFDFANKENISESNFRLIFKRETGLSFHKYFLNLKIEEAKKLLLENKYSLIDIAYHLNFSSQSHFQNVFKSIVGITPLNYLKDNQYSLFHI